MRRWALGAVVAAGVVALPERAEAIVMHDVQAFGQRMLHLHQQIVKYREIINASKNQLDAFKQALAGSKDWKNLSWEDTLNILDAPWFDRIEGIDQVRLAATATALTSEQARKLFADVSGVGKMRSDPRYANDPWYRARVESLYKYSNRARALKAALVRQMQAQNAQLIEDTRRIGELRGKVARENTEAAAQKRPVNQARIASLQAEIAAVEARYKGQEMMLKNQQAIMNLVGEDNAYWHYLETSRSDWLERNTQAVGVFGHGFAR